MSPPDWVKHAIWWQIYPLGFVGAEHAALAKGAPVTHRLAQVVQWLDYAVELGASGIALGPVFASETHGYDTTDYFRIDPRLGDDADFDRLITEAHARGLRVLLDGVFNHTGRSFGPFQDVLAAGPLAPTASWFQLTWPDGGWVPEREPGYANFEGHHHLPALNHEEPQVAAFVVKVMKHWLERGADGWRLDAAYAVPSPFWASVLGAVRHDFPDAYFVGEYIHGDYAREVRGGTLDSATQYELWKAVWSSLNDRNFYELAAALERHNSFLDTFVPLTFIGNHDVTRIASRLNDPALLPQALVVLFTLGGTPSVYYGDEQAFRGIKEDRAGGDDAIRPAFPGAPSDLSAAGTAVHTLHKQLIGIRRRHPWLHTARTTVLTLINDHLVYRVTGEGSSLVVALNLSPAPVELQLPWTTFDLLAGEAQIRYGRNRVGLPARGWAIMENPDS